MSVLSTVCHALVGYKVYFEILADSANLLGGIVLARDAFGRRRELKDRQLLEAVAKALPSVKFEPPDATLAVLSVRWARRGMGLVLFGSQCSC
jgi:hypothetical protein